jgi:hypothetical protein
MDYTSPMRCVYVLLAVIDKIPGSWSVHESRLQSCEGMSVFVGASHLRHRTMSSQAPSLQLLVRRPRIYEATYLQEYISIPLANTLFTTGQSSTLITQRYDVSAKDHRWPSFKLHSSYVKSVAQIGVPGTQIARSHQKIPLVPLTVPRKVKEAMGNIVRELDIDGESAPASTELERAVLTKAKSRPQSEVVDAKTRIYALLQPADTPASLSEKFLPKMLPPIFAPGLRLYEVIGGGGGWGSKVGLIALDPSGLGFEADGSAVNNTADTNTRMPPWEATDTESKPLDSQRDAMVKKGEWLSFWQLRQNFLAPNPDALTHSTTGLSERGWAISVGTIPTPDSLEKTSPPITSLSSSTAANKSIEASILSQNEEPASSYAAAKIPRGTDTKPKRRRSSVIIRDREFGVLSEKPILVRDTVFSTASAGTGEGSGQVGSSPQQLIESMSDTHTESTPRVNRVIATATTRITVPYSSYRVRLFNLGSFKSPPVVSSSDEQQT